MFAPSKGSYDEQDEMHIPAQENIEQLDIACSILGYHLPLN